MNRDTSGLVLILDAASPFEAHTVVSVLERAGIRAIVEESPSGATALDGSTTRTTPVWVRDDDAPRARAALDRRRTDSADLNWDEIDVGEREDDLPLTAGRRPILARVAFWVTALVALAGLAAFIGMLVV